MNRFILLILLINIGHFAYCQNNLELSNKYFLEGNNKADSGNYISAILLYSKAIQINSTDPSPFVNRGNCKSRMGDHLGAIEDFTIAIRLDPNIPQTYNNRGYEYFLIKNYSSALKDYDNAIGLDVRYAKAYFNKGLCYNDMGDFQKAIMCISTVIDLDPLAKEAYFYRGRAKFEMNDLDGSILDYSIAIQIDSNFEEAIFNRGLAREAKKDYADALSDLKKCELLDSNNVLILNKLGDLFFSQSNNENAIFYYSKVIEIDPINYQARRSRVFLNVFYRNNNEAAISDCNAILKQFEDPETYYIRGFLKGQNNDFAGSVLDLSKAIELNCSELSSAYYFRGLANIELTKKDDGCSDLLKSKELGKAEATSAIKEYCR